MKAVLGFLKVVDFFGVPYNFKYHSKENFTTSLGGVISLIFVVVCIALGIYNFIPFYNRKNFTTIYYTLKLPETEKVYFDKSKMAFSIGLNCWISNDGIKGDDLFDVIHKYIYWDVQEGEYVRRIETIETHTCTYADFYNDFNKAFDDSKIYNYQCLDDLSRTIEGIYASPIFSYYEFNVNAKNNSKKLLDKIENYLIENDCKLQIYYVDNTIDIDDYKNPIKSYLETDFIQLSPEFSIRKNMYFMNQHLYDDDYWIWFFNDQTDQESQLTSIYSRYEEYSLYQGLNRTSSSSDYLNWAKLFFRADTRKIYVKRKYQKVMEFYADASSLLVGIFRVLLIIFNYINSFYAELSLSKKIFFFKELNDYNYNINHSSKKVNDLLLESDSNKIQNTSTIETNYINRRRVNPSLNPFARNVSRNVNTIEKSQKKNLGKRTKVKVEILSTNKFDIRTDSVEQSVDKLKSNKLQTDNISYKKDENNIENQETINKNENETEKNNEINNYEDIKYEFNMLEIFFVSICNCCLVKKLGIKYNINKKAVNIINNSLDIVAFVQNVMLFNIINETILDDHVKSIVNFLSRPIISINKDNDKNDFEKFYRSYKESDFNKFSDDLSKLLQKPKKEIRERKLISLANKHLKNFLCSNNS